MTDSASENALLTAWQSTLERCGNDIAIVAPNGGALRRFADVESEAEAIHERLRGFPPRAVVAVQIGNSPSWPALLLALFRAALIPVPLGRHMEATEVTLALQTCGAVARVATEKEKLQIVPTGFDITPTWESPIPDFLKLTSGTTSAPRAVRFRAHQLLADCANICVTMGITRRDLNFGVIPFSHSYGFSNLITPLIAHGVPLVASEDRVPRAILNDLAATGATVFPGMPLFFQKFVELEKCPALPRLRLCISAGAPLPPSVAERFAEKFEQKIHPFYGASECGGIAYDGEEAALASEGFVGRALHGVTVERVGGDDAAPIVVRGPAVGDGYYPQADDATLSSGRFSPTDLVHWDGDRMFLVGRVSDVINIAGRKLNPLELERRLMECTGVKEVVVFGAPSSLRGEEPIACLVTEPGTNEATIARFCHTHLSPWQVPRDFWLVNEIPVSNRGKISRRLLLERYRAKTS